MDEPLLYESWGKKQTYILAFTPTEVVDVTEHYTRRVVFGLLLWCKTLCLPHQYAEFFEHGMMADVHDPILQFLVAFFLSFFERLAMFRVIGVSVVVAGTSSTAPLETMAARDRRWCSFVPCLAFNSVRAST